MGEELITKFSSLDVVRRASEQISGTSIKLYMSIPSAHYPARPCAVGSFASGAV